jgi:hypothetical protein
MGLGGDGVYKVCFRSHSLEKEIAFRCIDVHFDVNLRQIRLLYAGLWTSHALETPRELT